MGSDKIEIHSLFRALKGVLVYSITVGKIYSKYVKYA